MSLRGTERRAFLKQAAAAAFAGWVGFPAPRHIWGSESSGQSHAIRLGAPVFDAPEEPEEIARAHRKLGYRAAYCPRVDLDDGDRIRDVREAFAKHDVVIAEVGRWCNLLEADPGKRAANLEKVTDGLALAEAVGARCCV
ncbi:MAG: sugar phosphate isomerase/epimerase, partial [Planctomycetota bacterium]